MSHRTRHDERSAGNPSIAQHTLSIDIGGTHIKCSVLDPAGNMVTDRVEIDTPDPATPAAILRCIRSLVAAMPTFSRISAGFPGAVKAGVILTAPNLSTEAWSGFALSAELTAQLSVPARVLNDAAVQGLGVVQGPGLECVLTLGTGVGCAIYHHRRLILPMELGQHRARGKKTYDDYLGNAALQAKGKAKWNRRLQIGIDAVRSLVNFDTLYLGGGNARKVDLDLPPDVKIVSNTAGITGGVRLWERDMEEYFLPNS